MAFTVATYNVLASAHIRRAWYRRTPALVLDPAWRVPALAQHVAKLDADILCLQELEPESFASLRAFLAGRGYSAQYTHKQAGRPDGCAIFYRREVFELIGVRALAYNDGSGIVPDTGYVALIAGFRTAEAILGVANTHIIWDPPDTAPKAQLGLRQARQLVAEYDIGNAAARGWVVAGDFNATPESEIVSVIEKAGFEYAHRGRADVFTCNVGGSARMIDYLFYSSALHADPIAPTRIHAQTILPSVEQPSDHVAVIANFSWND